MAGLQLSYVDDLTPAKDFWDMKGKIIRVWRQSYRVDFILLDEKGSQIQGCVKNHLYPDFEESLKEDNIVLIHKFGVGVQMDKHRVIPLDHKINLFKRTTMSVVNGFSGDLFGFRFNKFSDILDEKQIPPVTVDVIGRLCWCKNLDIFRTHGKEHKRLCFDLEDLDGVILRITIWPDYTVEFNQFVGSTDGNLVVVAIQHGSPKLFNGATTVQNDMIGTRLFTNGDFDECKEFIESFIEKNGVTTSSTVLSSQTVYPLGNEFVLQTPKKNIDELLEINEPMDCIVVGTIKIIEEEMGWFYNAYRRCQKKAVTKTDYLERADFIPPNFIDAVVDSLWCVKCKSIATSLIPKFKLQVRVQDGTGSVSFVLFDSDVQKTVGLFAMDIRERQLKTRDNNVFPVELNVLNEKLLAFKIGVFNLLRKYNAYTIRKVCDDTDVISELESYERAEQVTEDEVGALTGQIDTSSQPAIESKESVSYTDDSLAVDIHKGSLYSPPSKRSALPGEDGTTTDLGSSSRTVKSKIQHLLSVVFEC